MNINNLVKNIFENENNHWYGINIKQGLKVQIVLKKDQKSGVLTTGIVKRVLTKKSRHTRGIKVELETGEVGRVQKIG